MVLHSCEWCGNSFAPRTNGGSRQRFCSQYCRQDFFTACRIWAAREYEAGRLTLSALRTALGQRARCVGADGASEMTAYLPRPLSAPSAFPLTHAA